MKAQLTIEKLKAEVKAFCLAESKVKSNELYGVTDEKVVGIYIESNLYLGQ